MYVARFTCWQTAIIERFIARYPAGRTITIGSGKKT